MFPPVKDDAHYEQLWGDDALWDRLIPKLLAHAHITSRTCTRIKSGSNIIYLLDDTLVFKLFAPLYADDAHLERAGLLAAHDVLHHIPSPELLDAGEHEGWHWLLITRLEGQPPVVEGSFEWLPELDARDRAYILTELAEWMRASWRSAAFQQMELPARWSSWEAVQDKLRVELADTHRKRGAEPAWIDQLEPFFEDWVPATKAFTVHADLHGRNLLISNASGRWKLSGVIDFADTLRAPPIYDLCAPLAYLAQGDPALCALFLERCLGASHGITARVMMQWILLHRFSNLGFYCTRLPHTAGRSATLDEMARHMTGLL